jgi:hypothetical protein
VAPEAIKMAIKPNQNWPRRDDLWPRIDIKTLLSSSNSDFTVFQGLASQVKASLHQKELAGDQDVKA